MLLLTCSLGIVLRVSAWGNRIASVWLVSGMEVVQSVRIARVYDVTGRTLEGVQQ